MRRNLVPGGLRDVNRRTRGGPARPAAGDRAPASLTVPRDTSSLDRRVRRLLLFAVVGAGAGCGRIGFHETPDDAAGSVDGRPIDGCTFGPFDTPRPLVEVNSPSIDWGPWLSPDKLELWFSSDRTGNLTIFRAQRASTTAAFDPPIAVDLGLSGDSDDPFITADGLSLYITNNSSALTLFDLYVLTRPTSADPFTNPNELVPLNSNQFDQGPSLTADALTLVFDSTRAGTTDLYIATRASTNDPFGAPSPISQLDSSNDECCAMVSPTGDSVIYADDQGSPNLHHIYQATKINDAYGSPTLLDPNLVGASGQEVDPRITPDGTTIVFGSNRNGNYDLYIAERACQ
jgi:Tol biopolymer transport system component